MFLPGSLARSVNCVRESVSAVRSDDLKTTFHVDRTLSSQPTPTLALTGFSWAATQVGQEAFSTGVGEIRAPETSVC